MCNITKIFKTLKAHFFPKPFVGRIRPFFHQSETTILIQFFPNIIVLFFIQRSKMSRNIYKLCVKLRNATIYPPWDPIWKKKKKFKKVLLYHLKCKTCSEGDIWKISRRRIINLKSQGPYKSNFCKKWVGA